MAFSQSNDQITDSVAQTSLAVLGIAPAIAMGNLYMATSAALAQAAHSAADAQQNGAQVAQAATALSIARLYNLR